MCVHCMHVCNAMHTHMCNVIHRGKCSKSGHLDMGFFVPILQIFCKFVIISKYILLLKKYIFSDLRPLRPNPAAFSSSISCHVSAHV